MTNTTDEWALTQHNVHEQLLSIRKAIRLCEEYDFPILSELREAEKKLMEAKKNDVCIEIQKQL